MIAPNLFKTAFRYLIRRPWQSVLMILGITLGVAVVVAIDLANASASRAFTLSTESIAGRATHQIVGGPTGIDEALYVELRQKNWDMATAPTITAYATSPQLGDLPMQLFGIDPFVDAEFRSYFSGDQDRGTFGQFIAFYTQPNTVVISNDLAERFGLEACEGVPLVPTPTCTFDLEISGFTQTALISNLIAPVDALSRRALNGIILADISTVQEMTGQVGRLSTIDLIVPEDEGDLPALAAFLPNSVQLQTTDVRSGTIQEMTSAFQVNLTALSLLALVVGLFLIYNTMTFSVIQRRPFFGTLRCLGVTRREVFILVVVEALLVGIIGSALGVLLGIVLGQAALKLVTQTINDLFFVLTVRGVDIPPASLVKGVVIGIGATVLAAAFPAWEAASVEPRAALSRSGLEKKAQSAVYLVAGMGIVLIFAGWGLLQFPDSSLVLSFAGTFAVIIGFAMLTPIVAIGFMRAITPLSGRVFGTLGRMAPRNVLNSLSRTSVAVAALMVAVSVTIGVSVMIGSFRQTVIQWLGQTLQGDVYISPQGVNTSQAPGAISPDALDIINDLDGVIEFDTLRRVDVGSPFGSVQLAATLNEGVEDDALFLWSIGTVPDVWAAMQDGAVSISEPLANRLNLPIEDPGTITLYTDAGEQTFPIVSVYSDYASTTGYVMMSRSTYAQHWNDDGTVNAVALTLEPGVSPDDLAAELEEQLAPIQQLVVRPNASLREETLVVFDRTFAITGALQLLATLVAFIGVLSALLSLQLEKQRELGVLRAVGLTVRQLWQMILLETGYMGAVAGLLAMPTGFVLSLILIFIINRRAFGWTLQMQVVPEPFIQALLVAVGAALIAGLYPARKIGQMQTAEALRGE